MHCNRYSDLKNLTRREVISRMGHGVGAAALASLMGGGRSVQAAGGLPGLPGLPHFAPKAKRVICLFMSGGMSQLESFDYKPVLAQQTGNTLPPSVFKGRKPLGMSKLQGSFFARGPLFPFAQHGQSGAWFSSCFPHLAKHADKMCFLKGMVSEAVNHDPAII